MTSERDRIEESLFQWFQTIKNLSRDELQHFTGLTWHEHGVCFQLEGLFRHVYPNQEQQFSFFQKELYASNLNQRLSSVGLKVAVFESEGKISHNWYQLQRL